MFWQLITDVLYICRNCICIDMNLGINITLRIANCFKVTRLTNRT